MHWIYLIVPNKLPTELKLRKLQKYLSSSWCKSGGVSQWLFIWVIGILYTTAIVQWSHPCKCQQPCHPCTPASPHCDRATAAAVRGAGECGQCPELHQLHRSLWGETACCGSAGQARSETKAPWVTDKIPCQSLSGGLRSWRMWCRAASGNWHGLLVQSLELILYWSMSYSRYVIDWSESFSRTIGTCSYSV